MHHKPTSIHAKTYVSSDSSVLCILKFFSEAKTHIGKKNTSAGLNRIKRKMEQQSLSYLNKTDPKISRKKYTEKLLINFFFVKTMKFGENFNPPLKNTR